jgi:signal transduction histidine kinase/response regulator of citrate/malate metabolism
MENTKYKVLLLEDDKIDQMAFKRLVQNKGLPYDYTVAASVAEAKSILGSERFDIVITDYLLGDGTAFDILHLVKNTPIIFVTGAGNEEIATEAWKAGAYDYLIKDHTRSYLKAVPITIRNAIKHKEMEEILERKQKNLEAIFDAVPVGMLLVDENVIVKRVNDAIRQMVHGEYSQIINQRVGNTLGCINSTYNEKGCGYSPACEKCLLQETVKTVLDSQQAVHGVEFRPTLKVDNKEVMPWLCISAEPAIIGGCKHVVVAIDDITDRKKAEEKLQEAVEIKSQFISTVSHELRTPLTSMKESVAIVLDGVAGKVNNKQRNFLDIAKRNIDRLAILINDVLDFQALDGSKFKLSAQENNINEVVEEAHKTMAFSAKNKGVDFSIELEDNLPKASFDRDKIIQVLTNLVGNAIKFTPEHGRVSVAVRCQGEELVIRVSDTGMGIPKEALPKMFERFYRVSRPGEKIQGTGLGLAIVKKIVMMHNGRIEVESKVGQGTTFTVFLPLTTQVVVNEHLPAKKDEHLESTLVNNQARTK